MARPEGVEPPTTWFVARYSIQLSYGRTALRWQIMLENMINVNKKIQNFLISFKNPKNNIARIKLAASASHSEKKPYYYLLFSVFWSKIISYMKSNLWVAFKFIDSF